MISSPPLANTRNKPATTRPTSARPLWFALPLAISILETIPVGLGYILLRGPGGDPSPISSLALVVAMMAMLLFTSWVRQATRAGGASKEALFTKVVAYGFGFLPLLVISAFFALPLFLPLGAAGDSYATILDILSFATLYARAVYIAETQAERPERLHEILFLSMRVGFGVILLTLICALVGISSAALLPALALALPLFVMSSVTALGLAQNLGLNRAAGRRGKSYTDSRGTWLTLLGRVAPLATLALMILEMLGYYAILGQLSAILNAIWFGVMTFISWLLWPLRWLWDRLAGVDTNRPVATQIPATAQGGTPQIGQGAGGGTGTPLPGGSSPGPGSGTPSLTGSPGGQSGTPAGQGGPGTPTGSLVPGTGTPSLNGTGSPASGTGTPGLATGTPGSGTGTPGSGHGTPGAGIGTPGPGTGTPNSGFGTPGAGTGTPGTGTPGSQQSGGAGNGHGAATPTPNPTATPVTQQQSSPPVTHDFTQLFTILLVIFAALVLVSLLLAAYLWWRNRPRTEKEEVAMAKAAQRKRRQRTRLEGPILSSVRAYYRSLLETAAKRGGPFARRPAETPTEYARRLRGVLPAGEAAADAQVPAAPVILDDLTDAYLAERYRGQPTPEERRTRLRSWLPRLLSAFQTKQKPT